MLKLYRYRWTDHDLAMALVRGLIIGAIACYLVCVPGLK